MEENVDVISNFVLSFYGPILTVILILFTFLLFYFHKFRSSLTKNTFSGQHVVVTGGSSGIGKSVAIEAATKGANVTIIARDLDKLKAAKEEISKACVSSSLQRIVTISLDVSSDADAVAKALAEAEEGSGPIFMLVNCAGSAVCGKIEDTSVDDFKYMMNLNYYGTVYPTKAVVAGMKERRNGHIVITASQAAMMGIYGFTAYSASKFALRGFAEALDMEVRSYGVRVTVCLPPDTDTPGFGNEEKSKPEETQLICQAGGLVLPDVVAAQLLNDAVAGKFYSTVGVEGFMMTTVGAGLSPISSFMELISQVALMGLLRFISVYYLFLFHRIIRKCMKKKDLAKKSE